MASLAFDGKHIAVGTHQGQARTWMQPAENTDFKTMLSPLQVDREQPVAHLMLSGARPRQPRPLGGGQRSAVGGASCPRDGRSESRVRCCGAARSHGTLPLNWLGTRGWNCLRGYHDSATRRRGPATA